MTKNRTPTPVYLDPGMHSGLEVKGLIELLVRCIFICDLLTLCIVFMSRTNNIRGTGNIPWIHDQLSRQGINNIPKLK